MQLKTNKTRIFFASLSVIVISILPVLIANGGNLFLVGDYMTQQIPFVKEMRRMFLSGTPFWSSNTFLGANFLGTFSFYNYASPFYIPLFLIPESLIGIGLSVMFALKHAVAATTAFLYFKNHIKTPHLSFIGALIYAFSSFSMDSSFYFHFIDVIAFFPLILLFTDKVLDNSNKPLLSVIVLLNAASNYYFFVSTTVFFLIYLFFKVKYSNGKYTFKDAARCVVFYAAGGFAAMIILIPAALSLLETNKATGSFASSFLRGLASIPQIIKLLKGIILPSEGIMGSATGFVYSNFNSNAAFLPFLGATFLFASLRKNSTEWHNKLIKFLFILTLTPFANGIFSFFTNTSYTRWWYCFVLIQVLVSLDFIESFKDNKYPLTEEYTKSIKTVSAISAVVIGGPLAIKVISAYLLNEEITAFLPESAIAYLKSTGILDVFSEEDFRYLAVLIIISLISYLPLFFSLKNQWIYQAKKAVSATMIICIATYGLYLANETNLWDSSYENAYKGIETAQSNEISYKSRTQYSYSLANYPMVSNKPGISAFHSFKSHSTAEFCRLIGFEDTLHTSSKAYFDTPAIQTVLSIETVVDKNGKESPAPYYTPFGYIYDYYVLNSGYKYTENKSENNKRIELMTKACIVDEETAKKLSGIAQPLSDTENINRETACKNNRMTACTEFELTAEGFTAISEGGKSRLVYFSIPNDKGWKAFVNGTETEILTLNGGMMGIIVPEGKAEILFKFRTPGLLAGSAISATAIVGLFAYCITERRKKPSKFID